MATPVGPLTQIANDLGRLENYSIHHGIRRGFKAAKASGGGAYFAANGDLAGCR